MKELLTETCDLLLQMYDPKEALFSYISRMEQGRLIHDCRHPLALRYTINSLAGLQEYVKYNQLDWDMAGHIHTFVERYMDKVDHPGDQGLLLFVLSRQGHESAGYLFDKIKKRWAGKRKPLGRNLQDLSWLLWGVTQYLYREHCRDAEGVARNVFKLIKENYISKDSLLPSYGMLPGQRHFVTFGGLCYFLRAVFEYGRIVDDHGSQDLFNDMCQRILRLQGPLGQWPWIINTRRVAVADLYPVFSVHQDSMAMLFLLPASIFGIEGANQAIEKSLAWLSEGGNELHISMIRKEPFFIYRAMHRRERFPQVRRYIRSLGRDAKDAKNENIVKTLKINPECRSYHLGWILFVWSPHSVKTRSESSL